MDDAADNDEDAEDNDMYHEQLTKEEVDAIYTGDEYEDSTPKTSRWHHPRPFSGPPIGPFQGHQILPEQISKPVLLFFWNKVCVCACERHFAHVYW